MARTKKHTSSPPHKQRRNFGNPISYPKPNVRFINPPGPKTTVFELDLETVMPDKVSQINQAKKIVFHCFGDSGGIHGTEVQDAISHQMEGQIENASDNDKAAFLYHLGDVVYFNGMSTHYEEQFYDPYKYYPAEIFAIPGNHDCDTQTQTGDEPDPEASLFGFIENFCDLERRYTLHSSYRKSMNQPYVYWTLNAPYVTMIGLFSNVDGSLDKDGAKGEQYNWLVQQLKKAPNDKCLIISVHHPIFSLDTAHGGYGEIFNDLKNAFEESKRYPDAIFHGHVHNYQRFNYQVGKKDIPVLIAGAAGYANTANSLHQLQTDAKNTKIVVPFQTTMNEVKLLAYNETDPGFLKITVDDTYLTGEYFINNFGGGTPPVNSDDSFKVDWRRNKMEQPC
jgi:calcineurin-like phosphoesterase family protein